MTRCTVCCDRVALCMVPDRCHDAEAPYAYHLLCGECLDAFLSFFPVAPTWVGDREVHGRLVRRRRPRRDMRCGYGIVCRT